MIDTRFIGQLLDMRRPGHTLPQPFYNDPGVYEADLQAIFYRSWLMIGFDVELPRTGSYLATTIGRSPIVVLRQKNGDIVGYHNSCRHRGAQICADGAGTTPRLVCPYHQWTYGLDGSLLAALRMGEDFRKAEHGLRPIRVETVAGCIYVCLTEDAPDFAPFRRAVEPVLAPHKLNEGKLAVATTITDAANWKLVVENGRECHHCAACHPELKIAFPVNNADRDPAANAALAAFEIAMAGCGLETAYSSGPWWNVGRFPLNEGWSSFSLDGMPLVGKPMLDANGGNVGTLRWAIDPNNFCHAAGDNALMFSALPIAPELTAVTTKWLVHKDAVEGVDYDVDRLTHVWTQTNLQDRALAENNQRGVNGVGYTPGPYSPDGEAYVAAFVDWYCDTMESYLAGSAYADASVRTYADASGGAVRSC